MKMWRYRPKMGRKNLDIGQIIAEIRLFAPFIYSLPQGNLISGFFSPCPKVGDTTSCYGGQEIDGPN